jgi:hypothetical protein
VAWRDALKNVVVDSNRATSNGNDGNYVFPDPGLFFGVGTPEGQARFFYNWLKYRPALIYRLTAQNSISIPFSSQVWRSMLHLPIDGLSSRPTSLPSPCSTSLHSSTLRTAPAPQNTARLEQTKSSKRLEVVQSLLKNCLSVDGIQINHTSTNDVIWREQQFFAGAIPPRQVAQEILWELFELNFRFEFMALDSRAHTPTETNAVAREDLILQCFPGTGSILVARRESAHQGLAASSWKDKAPSILSLLNVVRTWPGFDKVPLGCGDVDLSITQDVEAYSERKIDAMEVALANFYTQSFYDFFGRAAIIPRRLEADLMEPARL